MNSLPASFKKVFYHSNLLYSIRILVSLSGTTFIPYILGDIKIAIPLTLGVLAAEMTDIDSRLLSKLINIFLTLLCFVVATFSVQLLFPYPAIFIVGLVTSTFLFTMLGALGQRYKVIAFGSLLIAAYTMLAYEQFEGFYVLPGYLLLGASWYYLIAIIETIIQPVRTTQQSLAQSFLQLSTYLDAKANMFDPDESNHFYQQTLELTKANDGLIEALNQTKTSLFNRLKSYRGQSSIRLMLNYYFVAQDIHERASSNHANYQALSQKFKHSDILFRFARIMNLQAKACEKIAVAIKYHQPYEHSPIFDKYFDYLHQALEQTTLADKRTLKALNNLYQNLQSINLLLANINSEQSVVKGQIHRLIIDDELHGFSHVLMRIKQNITLKSPLFRHALRMCLVLLVGYIIIQLTDLSYGYWIILTSLLVCQPNYTTTKHRLRLRVLGTIMGIIIGVPLVYLSPNVISTLLLVVLSGWLFFLFKSSRYAYATAFITLLVFFSFALIGENSLSVAIARIIATVIGCCIAWLAVSFIWPDWQFRNLALLVERAYYSDCHYLALIGMQYQFGKNNDVQYRLARRAAHENNTELSTLITIMSQEPKLDQAMTDLAFRFLTLNHTLISYISTLGAHRDKTISQEALLLFDDITVYIINTLNNTQKINKDYPPIRQMIISMLEKSNVDEHNDLDYDNTDHHFDYNNNDFLVLQQLLLIMDLLPELTQLIAQISREQAYVVK